MRSFNGNFTGDEHTHAHTCTRVHTHTQFHSHIKPCTCVYVSLCVSVPPWCSSYKRQIIGKKKKRPHLLPSLHLSLSHSPPFGRQAKKKNNLVNNLFACDIDSFIPVVFYCSSLRLVRRWEGVGGINTTCVRVRESV